jgi:hypothetical protein
MSRVDGQRAGEEEVEATAGYMLLHLYDGLRLTDQIEYDVQIQPSPKLQNAAA